MSQIQTKEARSADEVRSYVIKSLLRQGHSTADVARLVGVSVQQVERLRYDEKPSGTD